MLFYLWPAVLACRYILVVGVSTRPHSWGRPTDMNVDDHECPSKRNTMINHDDHGGNRSGNIEM